MKDGVSGLQWWCLGASSLGSLSGCLLLLLSRGASGAQVGDHSKETLEVPASETAEKET